jgi:hypothetical protein
MQLLFQMKLDLLLLQVNWSYLMKKCSDEYIHLCSLGHCVST